MTLNDVLDRVVQREHLFMAQMRHMHPLVETYLQDLKNDSDGNTTPVKDQYFLGRLDMVDGPEDMSFVGQPGFGHRMVAKLTGVYSLRFLPMGFAQMVVLDSDFQKKYYNFTFVRREFLGELRCLVIDVQPKEGQKTARFHGQDLGRRPGLQHRPLQRKLLPAAQDQFLLPLRQLAPEHAPGNVAAGLCLHRRIEPEDWTYQDSALQSADSALGI